VAYAHHRWSVNQSAAHPSQTAAKTHSCEHADHIERLLERHGPDGSMVRLSLTGDVFLRSFNWARGNWGSRFRQT
jgi:hypothetical protein